MGVGPARVKCAVLPRERANQSSAVIGGTMLVRLACPSHHISSTLLRGAMVAQGQHQGLAGASAAASVPWSLLHSDQPAGALIFSVNQKKDLHQMAEPTIFSNPLEKWIFHKTESVFFVDFVPKEDADVKIKEILDQLETVPEDKREKLTFEDKCCTGFVVDDKSQELKVLCSAHCLDHLFTSGNPISAHEIGDLYDINIICDHYDHSFRKDKTVDKIRYYSRAHIVQIDCEKDLILLNVSKKNVLGKNGRACRHSHPALVPSKRHLEPMEKVLMVSWPPFRPRTVASGKVSHCDREYADTSKTDLVGYTMTLVEVNILSEPGGSGAPLLDADANFTGVLHGGADGCSWFISLPDICQALTSWGILTQ
uniref:Peptidase S1 domain-containing protein n=1 Tax=Oryza punctata TaxID=4537 RepID=A0A0E0KYF7_ORYPU